MSSARSARTRDADAARSEAPLPSARPNAARPHAARPSAARPNAARPSAARPNAARLERVFAGCFAADFRTLLLGGAAEPFYRPASGPGGWHELHYREDYFASALHEVAHWCIAGEARRRLADFGYWYAPEGRDARAQRAFEAVEAAPQALEWLFSLACGVPFRLSADNIDPESGELPDLTAFARDVAARSRRYLSRGLPQRAERFRRALCREFDTDHRLRRDVLTAERLL